jgi:hypothetical protein
MAEPKLKRLKGEMLITNIYTLPDPHGHLRTDLVVQKAERGDAHDKHLHPS